MTIVDPTKWERRRLKSALLKPHPAQRDYYGHTTTPTEDDALRRDLQENGQRDPIHVMPPKNKAGLPAYTVLDGRRRAAGLEAIGKKEADVVVRHDLTDADAATVEAVFLGFNVGRRQLHPLDKARVVLRLYELEKGRSQGRLYRGEVGEARDRVGAAIGMSGRNLQRYFRVLLTPLEVQLAVRDGRLPLVMGERVECFEKIKQADVAARIRAGEDPKKVVGELYATNGRRRRVQHGVDDLVNSMERALGNVGGRVDEIRRHNLTERKLNILEQGKRLIEEVITYVRNGDEDA
jgi:hypothetical protein